MSVLEGNMMPGAAIFSSPISSPRSGTFIGVFLKNGGRILLISVSCIVVAGVLLATDGDIFVAAALLVLAGVVLMTAYRLDFGYYFLIGCVLAFDQFPIPFFNSPTAVTGYFLNLKEFPHLSNFTAGVVNPLELHLFLLITVWAFMVLRRGNISWNGIPVWGATALFFLALCAAFAHGMMVGGDMLPALWEIRAMFYLGILYVLTPQIIRTREQMFTFFWVCIVIISFKAYQGLARYISLGWDLQGLTTLTNHEDALFMLSLFILMFCLWFWKSNSSQRRFITIVSPLLLLGFYVAQRRAVYAAMGPSALMIFILLSSRERWRFLKRAVPAAILVAIYCAVFWNSENILGAPVRLVKSGISLDKETAGERYYSNLYREKEKYDLAVTAQHAPVFGIGFGKKYEMPIKLVKIPFTLRDYIGHNEIMWLFVKLGAAGFYFFCFFIDAIIFYGASLFSRLKDPYLKTICIVVLTALLNQVIISYYDLQLTYYRNMVFLGALLGMLPVIRSLHEQSIAAANTTGQAMTRERYRMLGTIYLPDTHP